MKPKIKIETGVPKLSSKKGSTIYPFEGLRIGDSFIAGEYTEELMNQINGHIYYYSKKLGVKFSQKRTGDHIRVWRVEP